MNKKEFAEIRIYLNKTQRALAQLLGTSLKAVQSFEQGWRNIPVHIERQMYFLLCRKNAAKNRKPCWVQTDCPMDRRKTCPSWELKCGDLCWFINGTVCEGKVHKDWSAKMKKCKKCRVFLEMCALDH